jgi:hypothetical protein
VIIKLNAMKYARHLFTNASHMVGAITAMGLIIDTW